MSTQGNKRFPSGNWFWHEWDKSVRSKEEVLEYLKMAKAVRANLLLNVGPTNEGILREEDEQVLQDLQN